MGNMYTDSKFQWNVIKGCNFNCKYCIPSFQRQAKRQKHRCMDCYNYTPHLHEERLNQRLPRTYGDEFIWCCSSGDIYFAKEEWMHKVLEKILEYPNRTFFFQTKSPDCYYKYEFPSNCILGITLETDYYPEKITDAMQPWYRFYYFKNYDFPRKVITIEPIQKFTLWRFVQWIEEINPIRVYIGYNSKPKSINLIEPTLEETQELIKELKNLGIKVKIKYMRDN